jgi:thiol:disulfide interchange protein DsbC
MTTRSLRALIAPVLLALGALASIGAQADENTIRKTLAQRLPDLPKPDEVTKSAMPGLWEVRIGFDLLYTDAEGNYLIEGGALIDTKTKANLTQQRADKLSAIRFEDLPLKDALVSKQGRGTRRLAVFGDPNCGYCKRLERDLAALTDVTIYNFVYPVLGPDSQQKSQNLWCAKEPMKAWRAWMLEGHAPQRAMGQCDTSAIDRTVAFGRKYRINGTPAMVFEDGQRVPGAMSGADIEKRLVEARKPGKG